MDVNSQHVQDVISLNFNQRNFVFNSHEFIDKYRRTYETDYIQMLVDNQAKTQSNGSFQETNRQFGDFLFNNQTSLGIEFLCKRNDKNDLSNRTPVAFWRKL